MANKENLLLIFGGRSSEYEVSLRSAASVLRATDREKYNILTLGITKSGEWYLYSGTADEIENGGWISDPENLKRAVLSPDAGTGGLICFDKNGGYEEIKISVVFGVLHGKYGEDGKIQGLFELSGIPYVGSDVLSSALCMDKAISRTLFDHEGLPQAKWIYFPKSTYELTDFNDIIKKVHGISPYPVFVKPANAGSSVGISKVTSDRELKIALDKAFEHDKKVLVEEGLDAREVEISVLGNNEPTVSACGEIVPCNDFYDYDAKYLSSSELIIPAELPPETVGTIESLAKKAYRTLCCEGLSRVDFLVRKSDQKVFLNEVNTIPGFTSISMYPKLFEYKGIPYKKLLDALYGLAKLRTEEQK